MVWIIEKKAREDIQDPRKWEHLKLWYEDATRQEALRVYRLCSYGRRISCRC